MSTKDQCNSLTSDPGFSYFDSDLYDHEQGAPQGGILYYFVLYISKKKNINCLDNKIDGSQYVDGSGIRYYSKNMKTTERHLQKKSTELKIGP